MFSRLLIVAGESSGELYGSLLADYLRNDFELIGIGGKHMARAGVKLIGGITHAFGALEVVGKLRKLRENMKSATEALKNVDGVILIDFPDFNLRLAKKAKILGKKVLYYVSPQIWAWRKGRINILKEVVDFMATVLPFEEQIYKNAHVPVKFVGHPIFEVMKRELNDLGLNPDSDLNPEDKRNIKEKFGIKQDTVITLMPGSRPSEIKRKMPLMLSLINYFDRQKIHFIIPKAPDIEFDEETLKKLTFCGNVTVLKEQAFTALAMSDVAIIASGTSTLQATLLKIPMIVIYRLNPFSYMIGKTVIKGVKHIAIPNVIADFMNEEGIRVPEFIQKISVREVAEEINKMLYDGFYRNNIINFLGNIKKYFIGKEASKEVYSICKKLFY